MKRATIILAFHTYHDKPAVSLRFAKDYDLTSKVKTLKGAGWSQSRKSWYIPQIDFKPSEVFDKLSPFAFSDDPDLKNQKQESHATKSQKLTFINNKKN
jgi:hypothetical protein